MDSNEIKWPKVNLGSLCDIFTGKKDVNQSVTQGKYVFFSCSPKEFYSDDYLYNGDAIIVVGNGSYTGKVRFFSGKFDLYQRTYACVLKPLSTNASISFLYYVMKNQFEPRYLGGTRGSSIPYIVMGDLANFEFLLPPVGVQRKIAGVLGALDDKIELNNKINQNLELQAQALFKSWFVDFEPFGGKMPDDWKIYKLGDFLPVITGKKNANVSSSKGKYPFFSCSQDIAWTDDYSFEGNAILVAGNGDFNVKFYNGKFEAYQRTYVLIPHNPRYTDWLYYAVKRNLSNITSGARGSVISFITKGNLENFEFAAPSDLDSFNVIDVFSSINKIILSNKKENEKLSLLRDTLLPKLMSGEINVDNVDVSARKE